MLRFLTANTRRSDTGPHLALPGSGQPGCAPFDSLCHTRHDGVSVYFLASFCPRLRHRKPSLLPDLCCFKRETASVHVCLKHGEQVAVYPERSALQWQTQRRMKTSLNLRSTLVFGFVLALLGSHASTQAASKSPENTRATTESLDLRTAPKIAIPQSVFTMPSQPSGARNPFFPQSVMVTVTKPSLEDPNGISSLVLDGITSPPKPTAMINGRTFEVREEGEVKSRADCRVWIKCIEIKSDSIIIEVKG